MTLIVSGLSFGFLPLSMNMRISNMKIQIDKELPYTLSELSILASTGLSPMEILRRMAKRDVNQHMKGEFNRIVYKVDVEGKDVITSLGEAAKETPSTNLREMLWDFATLIHQGGDLDVYLRSKADENLRLKRDIQKEFIEKLSMFSEIYINVTLIGALVGGIGAFLLDATDSTMAGLDGAMALGLLTYIATPMVIVVVLILISMAYARTE
jgi:flagellar protein FlaJ